MSRPLQLHTYRLGQAGLPPGLSLGVTHYLPRGVPRSAYVTRGYFDVWLPLLAPSGALLASIRANRITFARFARLYRAEMRQPAARQAIRLVAAVATQHRVNLGCFCADESRCHRILLRDLVLAAAVELPGAAGSARPYASPPCALPEIED